jgi:hypothetical protein
MRRHLPFILILWLILTTALQFWFFPVKLLRPRVAADSSHIEKQKWELFLGRNPTGRTKVWRTPANMSELDSFRTGSLIQRCSEGGWASLELERLAPTKQENLASGYTYFENLYFVDGKFTMVQDAISEKQLKPDWWALIDWEKQKRQWGEGTVRRWFESEVFEASVGKQCHLSSVSNALHMTKVSGAIMITDFLPKYEVSR